MNIFRIIVLGLFTMISSSGFAQPEMKVLKTIYSGLQSPTSFYITQNEIFVVEQEQDQVLKLDLNGKLLESYGNKGSGDYQFNRPFDIDATNGLKVYISDTRNNRIQVFDKRWQLLSSITGYEASNQNQRIEPTWLGVTKLGHLIFLDQRSGYLVKMDENGTFLDEIPIPKEVKEISKLKVLGNSIFILDNKSSVIHRLSDLGFYETFYPVENVKSFSFNGQSFWILNDKSVSNKDKSYSLELDEKVQDIFIHKESIYLLTDKNILLVN